MVILLVAVSFGVGAVAGFYFRAFRRAPAPASDGAEEHPRAETASTAPEVESPAYIRVLKAAEELAPDVGRMARPGDILELPRFREAVAWLTDPRVDVSEVRDLALGSNDVAAYIAYTALRDRDDGRSAAISLLGQVKHCDPWPLFFLLRCLCKHAVEPVIGRVLLNVQGWWSGAAQYPRIVRAFVDERLASGERPTFGNELATSDGEQIEAAREMLRHLGTDVAAVLQAEIDQWRRTTVDETFLLHIGRLLRSADFAEWRPTSRRLMRYVDRLIESSSPPAKSVLLVGQPGAGTRYVALAYLESLQQRGVRSVETSGQMIIAGQKYIGEIEQRARDVIDKASAARGLALFMPRFHELATLGGYREKPEVLLDYLLPSIEARTINVVGTITPHAYQALLQKWPSVRTSLDIVQIRPATDEEALEEIRELIVVRRLASDSVSADLLATETLQLIKQYTSSDQLPGTALDLLQVAAQNRDDEGVALTRSDLIATLSRITGLPREILDEQQALDLAALRDAFLASVVGQDEAVDCLIERIALIKAGLSDPSKPSAVLLFAGPTGSGKTELAKTLARLLFGSEDRMIRLDMSELASPDSVELVKGLPHATREQRSLITRIREQPFAVILLDEFEKAHPRVWDLFLQVFDDGRLSDTQGNVADFRHAIIILTSNLGATINPNAGMGFTGAAGQFDAKDVLQTVMKTFRREFVNRLDRVLVFRPLSRESMRRILDLQLKAALQRRGFRNKTWAVEWEDTAVSFLLDKGFTLDLGARPLKRAIERYFLAPLSKNIVEKRFPKGDQFLFVRARGDELEAEFVDPDQEASSPEIDVEQLEETSARRILLNPRGLRAESDFLIVALNQTLDRLTSPRWLERKAERFATCNQRDFWERPGRHRILAEIELIDRMETALESAERLAGRLRGVPSSKELIRTLAQKLYLLPIAYDELMAGKPFEAFIGVKPLAGSVPAARYVERLVGMYRSWAKKRGMRLRPLALTAFDESFAITGFGCYTILAEENGLHIFEQDDERITVRVHIAPQPTEPQHDERRFAADANEALAASASNEVVRRYQLGPASMVRDLRAGWRTGRLQRVLEGDFDLLSPTELNR